MINLHVGKTYKTRPNEYGLHKLFTIIADLGKFTFFFKGPYYPYLGYTYSNEDKYEFMLFNEHGVSVSGGIQLWLPLFELNDTSSQ